MSDAAWSKALKGWLWGVALTLGPGLVVTALLYAGALLADG